MGVITPGKDAFHTDELFLPGLPEAVAADPRFEVPLLIITALTYLTDVDRALCANQRRLVSPFDVHATLRALLSYPQPPELPDWSAVPNGLRPRSLLVEVPADRTCDEAGVPPGSCPCA